MSNDAFVVSQPQSFNSEEFGELQIIEEDGKLLFRAIPVAEMLGYVNPRKAINDHCKGVTKRDVLTNGGIQQANFITEGDLYRLIVHSKLPSAERFESWVFDEVLPTIRKTGSYSLNEKTNSPLQIKLDAIRKAKDVADILVSSLGINIILARYLAVQMVAEDLDINLDTILDVIPVRIQELEDNDKLKVDYAFGTIFLADRLKISTTKFNHLLCVLGYQIKSKNGTFKPTELGSKFLTVAKKHPSKVNPLELRYDTAILEDIKQRFFDYAVVQGKEL